MKRMAYIGIGFLLGLVVVFLIPKRSESEKTGCNAPTLQRALDAEANASTAKKPNTANSSNRIDSDVTNEVEVAAANPEDEILDLFAKVWSGDASTEEQLAFWQKVRESDEIDRSHHQIKGTDHGP